MKVDMSSTNKTIIILGMHRTGTSMIGGVLQRLEINMGDVLLKESDSNPFGHYEDKDFLLLNQRILKAAGGNWANPPKENFILEQKRRFNEEIKSLILKKNHKKIWGWKEPRTSLTIKLYFPYLKNPHFIICKRKIQDIAKSLLLRNNMKIEKGEKLAQEYEKRVESFLKGYNVKKIYLNYEEVTSNPKREVAKIINFLGCNFQKAQIKKAISFIRTKEEMKKYKKKKKNKNPLSFLERKLLNFLKNLKKKIRK